MKINMWHLAKQMHYVVVNENALGCTPTLELPYEIQVLAVSIRKGGNHRENSRIVMAHTKVRPATLQDFDDFRLMPPSDFL